MLTLIRGRSAKEKNCDAKELKRAAGSLSPARSTSRVGQNRRELNNQSNALVRCLRFALNTAWPRPLSYQSGDGNFRRGGEIWPSAAALHRSPFIIPPPSFPRTPRQGCLDRWPSR